MSQDEDAQGAGNSQIPAHGLGASEETQSSIGWRVRPHVEPVRRLRDPTSNGWRRASLPHFLDNRVWCEHAGVQVRQHIRLPGKVATSVFSLAEAGKILLKILASILLNPMLFQKSIELVT